MNENKHVDRIRHTLSHLLATAVLEKFPNAKPVIGPTIEDGFYYDFDVENPFTLQDLAKLEKRMRELVQQKLDMVQLPTETTLAQTPAYLANNPYKQELVKDLKGQNANVTFYRIGKFTDLCKGGHVENTSEIKPDSFKLTKVAGAYWRGDSTKQMLQRIYGVAFENKKALDAHLAMLEEAEKRDHRKLGQQLELFTFSDLVGSGLPLYTPSGALVRRLLNEYVEEVQAGEGYEQVWTPQIAKAQLFKTSGHYDKYRESMFRVKSNYSDEELYLKPMNCPQHTQIYASQPRSYRDLPIRYTDFAMLYRDEKPGELSGLGRVRAFSQDDCHVFCREDQVDAEIDRALSMIKRIMKTFGLSYRYRLSTRDPKHPEQYIGDPKIWDRLEQWAKRIMIRNTIDYFDGPGEAAFYAPKMDLIAKDALGREHQLSTVQIDYFLPERFNLTYADKDGKDKRPVMIHRAIIGSSERFIMILLEHLAGQFPTWLAPIQVSIIPVGSRHVRPSNALAKELHEAGVRVAVEDANETVGYKIRKAARMRVPYMLVIGDKEAPGKAGSGSAGKLHIRIRGKKAIVLKTRKQFLEQLQNEISTRKLTPRT